MAKKRPGDEMDRKRIWGWWFFDWASQPYATLLLTFVFSIYFAEIAKSHFIALGDGVTLCRGLMQCLFFNLWKNNLRAGD